MRRKGKPLTAAFVRTVTRPGRYGDGRGGFGLSLLVKPMSNGRVSRTWSQRVVIDGRPTSIGMGSFPRVTLAQARKMALDNRRELDAGRDPRGGGIPTFEAAAERLIELRRDGWRASRTEVTWRNTFRNHARPIMGKPVDKVTTSDLLAIIGPVWHSKPSVGRVLRQRLSAVFTLVVAEGWRNDDPAGPPLVAVLPKGGNGKREHFRALPADQVADALRHVRGADVSVSVRLLIEFLALTGVRTVEARMAEWFEIDTAAAVWSIPGDKTKTGDPHRVALSTRAVEVLAQARTYSGPDGLIFPGRSGDRPVGAGTPARVFRDLAIPGTVHGLRSSLRTWAADQGYPREVCESVLGHRTGGPVELSYSRTDYLARRRELMEAWAEHISC